MGEASGSEMANRNDGQNFPTTGRPPDGSWMDSGQIRPSWMENRKFTNTALPVFSGAEGWYQHIHIVQAIVKSNGWPDETAALQLFVHLKGEALNVAFLLTKKERESWDRTGRRDWRHITNLRADWRV